MRYSHLWQYVLWWLRYVCTWERADKMFTNARTRHTHTIVCMHHCTIPQQLSRPFDMSWFWVDNAHTHVWSNALAPVIFNLIKTTPWKSYNFFVVVVLCVIHPLHRISHLFNTLAHHALMLTCCIYPLFPATHGAHLYSNRSEHTTTTKYTTKYE